MQKTLNYQALLRRFLLTLLLVFMTYNPTGLSYLDWLVNIYSGNSSAFSPSFILLTLLLAGGWAIYLKNLYGSLGKTKIIIAAILFALILWWMFDLGLFNLAIIPIFNYIGLVLIAVMLTVAISWSHFHHILGDRLNINKPNN